VGYRGPVGALAIGGHGNLYVHAGGNAEPLRLSLDAGCVASGVMWGPVKSTKGLPSPGTRRMLRSSLVRMNLTISFMWLLRKRQIGPAAHHWSGWNSKGLDVGDFFLARKINRVRLGLHMSATAPQRRNSRKSASPTISRRIWRASSALSRPG